MPSRSWNTSTCPSVAGPAPIPITGISMRRHQLVGDGGGDRLEHEREAARLLQRERLRADLRGRGGGAALGLPAAERGRGLGGEADVAHHGDARGDDRARAS